MLPVAPVKTRHFAAALRRGALALALPAALLVSAPAFAADAAKVDELMVVLKLDEMTEQMQKMMDEVMEKTFVDAARERGLDDAEMAALRPRIDRLKQTLREALAWETMAPAYRQIYIEVLTDAEVDGAIAYYRSPAGASMMAKMPELMQRGMEVGQRRAAEVMPRAMAELKGELDNAAKPAAATE